MKKILITGGSGLLGQYLNIELAKQFDILTLYRNNIGNCKDYNSVQTDITNIEKLTDIFSTLKPDIVLHTAAIANPNTISGNSSGYIYNLNVNVTKNIAELCEKFNSKLIYTSTDLVYAGYRGSMLNEDAKLVPVSLYAETKLMGEVKIKETFNNYIILRTALLFGFGLNNSRCHFHFAYDALKRGEQIKLFYDQYRPPLSLFEASRVISKLIKLDLKEEIINFGGTERISRLGLIEELCNAAGLDKSLLQSVSMNDVKGHSHVADVSMNTSKIKNFGIDLLSVYESIREIITKYS